MLALGLFLLALCSAPTAWALNGDVIWGSGCSDPEREKILAAMAHIESQFFGGEFRECVEDAVMVWDNHATPEAIVRRIRENEATKIHCVDASVCGAGNDGCVIGRPTHEEINLFHGYIQASTTPVEGLAGTIVHEVAHTKGWFHPPRSGSHPDHSFAYSFTVPVQVGHCLGFPPLWPVGEPNFLARSSLTNETELAHVGGGGGQPYELRCTNRQIARGARVEASATRVNRLALRCNAVLTPSAGSTADSTETVDYQCPPGDALVGFLAASGSLVNGLLALCGDIDDVRAGSQALSTFGYLGGEFTGDVSLRQCPPHQVVKHVYGRDGARIDQMRVVCKALDTTPHGNPINLPRLGTARGRSERRHCLGNGVMVSILGRAGGEVDRLGGECMPTRGAGFFGALQIDADLDKLHLLPEVGGPGGSYFQDYCDDIFADAVVGFQVRSGARLDQVRAICADAQDWASSAASVPTHRTPPRGGNTGVPRQRLCPRGHFVVGMHTWSDRTVHATDTVHGLTPICRKIDYRPILQQLPDGAGTVGALSGEAR
ncbi:MAG: hypothetical protein MJE66_17280 [Proteobacteria bacterium]|nr:hypothetical protein [Pseudomonadota bacterium]